MVGIAVVVTSFAGALVVGFGYSLQHVKSDEPPLPEAIFWGLGAVLGAWLGAMMERPQVVALGIPVGGLASSISMALLIPHPDSALTGFAMVLVTVASPCIGHFTASGRNAGRSSS